MSNAAEPAESREAKKSFVVLSVVEGSKRTMNPSFEKLKRILSTIGVYFLEECYYGERGEVFRLENLGNEVFLIGKDRRQDCLKISDDEILGKRIRITKESYVNAGGVPLVVLY